MNLEILQGDCREQLAKLPDGSVNCCVTSPPYWGLRDYGVDGQLGLEKTPEEYVAKMVEVFREVRRVLQDDGTLWLNLGDSYNAYNGNRGTESKYAGDREKFEARFAGGSGLMDSSLKPKDLVGIPWRVAFALQSDGWYLRQDIIWHKPNPMPESVRDRFTKAHEYIFLLSKSQQYYFDQDAVKEPAACGHNGSDFHTGKTGEHQLGRASTKPRAAGNKRHKYTSEYETKGDDRLRTKAGLLAMADEIRDVRNKRSVWTVSTKPFPGAHFATFPPDLIIPCILAGCPEGGTVLDPFLGSGTTAQVAIENGRNAIGIELNPEYIELAESRTRQKCLF